MLGFEQENLEGDRIAVEIDPSKEFLQLAILSPSKQTEFKKLPLLFSIKEEFAQSIEPASGHDAHRLAGSCICPPVQHSGKDLRGASA